MAEKKTASRAEQAVSGAKKKTASGSASKSSGKKSTPAKNTKYKTEYEPAVPPHFLIAAVSILLFALFVEYLQGKVVSVKDNAPEAVVRKEPA